MATSRELPKTRERPHHDRDGALGIGRDSAVCAIEIDSAYAYTKCCRSFALRQPADYRAESVRAYAPFATTCQAMPMRGLVLPRENGTMANGEQDIMEDLAYAEVEGPSELMMEDESELFDSLES